MQPMQRTAVRSVRQLRPRLQRQCRRNASDSHGSHSSHDAHPTPKSESFGAGFYIALAAFPASFAIFKFTQRDASGEQPYFTRLIKETYNDYATKWAQRNDLHTQMIEQAAADRVLFLNEAPRGQRYVDLRFPEQFNTGSPWNVPAGHGSVNIDEVVAKYQKEAYEEQEKRLQQLKENKVPVEQPFDPLPKSTAARHE